MEATNSQEIDDTIAQATVSDDFASSNSEVVTARVNGVDTGHERLLTHKASNEGKSIAHCRASVPPHYLYLALLVCLINLPFGILAVVFSLISRYHHRCSRSDRAKHWGLVSKWISFVGIAVAVVLIAFTIVYFVHIDKNIVDTREELTQDEGMKEHAI